MNDPTKAIRRALMVAKSSYQLRDTHFPEKVVRREGTPIFKDKGGVIDDGTPSSESSESSASPLTYTDLGLGLRQYHNDDLVIHGGHRVPLQGTKGTDRLKYQVYSRHSDPPTHIGDAEINTHPDDKSIEGLVNLNLKPKFRKSGYGSKIVNSLVASSKDGLNLYDIKNNSIPFWKKMGASFEKFNSNIGKQLNGIIHKDKGGAVDINPNYEQNLAKHMEGAHPGAPLHRETGGEVDDQSNQRELNPQGLYSGAAEAAMALPQERGTPQQMLASLKGVKPEEIKWSGVQDAMAGKKLVTKQELAEHFKSNLPSINEINKPNGRYKQFQIPGGENYREKVLEYNNPNDPNMYSSSHWNEAINPLLHLRMSDRVPPQRAVKIQPANRKISGFTNQGQKDMDAWDTATPGIVITRPLEDELDDKENNKPLNSKSKFKLTHEHTGRVIRGTNHTGGLGINFYDAQDLAKRLGEHYNWDDKTKTSEDISKYFTSDTPEAKDRLSRIQEEFKKVPTPLPSKKKLEKSLHLEEVQSDWAQSGRQYGFVKPKIPREEGKLPAGYKVIEDPSHQTHDDDAKKYLLTSPDLEIPKGIGHHRNQQSAEKHAVDNFYHIINDWNLFNLKKPAPYVTNTSNWTDLALKRALTEAAQGGYDKIIWTPGEHQAKRYNLSKQVSNISYHPSGDGINNRNEGPVLRAYNKERNLVFSKPVKEEELPNYIGKEVSQKLLSSEPNYRGIKELMGQDLNIGGEGMKGYYDKILPKRLLALAREHDPDVQIVPHKTTDTKVKGFPSISISPAMRESILKKGFKAYKSGGYIADNYKNKIFDNSKQIRSALMVAKGIKNAAC